MTAEEFQTWLKTMKEEGVAKSDADCARILDRSDQFILNAKKKGTDKLTAFACAAVLAGVEPFGKAA